MEEKLRKSEDKFRKAFYTSADSVNINRLEDGLYVSINPGFTRITGIYGRGDPRKNRHRMQYLAQPQDRRRLLEGLKGTDVSRTSKPISE